MFRLFLLAIIVYLPACAMYPELSKLDGTEPLQSRVYDAPYKETYFAAIDSASGMQGQIMSRSLDSGEIIIDGADAYIAKVSVVKGGAKTRVEFRIDHKWGQVEKKGRWFTQTGF